MIKKDLDQKKMYKDKFDVESSHSLLLQEAFKQVSDIRKFEIELYWKRATYFWALIAITFAGYFSVASAENIPAQYFFLSVISSAGMLFTFAWFTANKGSKYWQENWENHLDLLEDNVTGPLYKSYFEKTESKNKIEKYITGPQKYSVSKINQWVGVFVMFTWVVLILFSFALIVMTKKDISFFPLSLLANSLSPLAAVYFCRQMIISCESNKGRKDKELTVGYRTVSVNQ